MITETRRWEIACDSCDHTVTVDSRFRPPLPEGWTDRPAGRYSYFRTEQLCPQCSSTHDSDTEGSDG